MEKKKSLKISNGLPVEQIIESGSTKSRLGGEYPNLQFSRQTFGDAIFQAVFTIEDKAFIMSRFCNREPTKYILLKRMKLDFGTQCEVLRRGQIFTKLNEVGPYLPSGSLPLYDNSRRLKFLCPAEEAATVTEAEVKTLMRIACLEDRYKAFKEGCRFENPLEAGTKVFVVVNGREYPGVIKVVLPGFSVSSPEPVFKVEIQENSLPVETFMHSELNMLRLSPNAIIVDAIVSCSSLRPRYEKHEEPRWSVKSCPEDYSRLGPFGREKITVGIIDRPDDYFHSRLPLDNFWLDWKQVPLPTTAAQLQDHKEAGKWLIYTNQTLNGEERDLPNSEQILHEFKKNETSEQRVQELETTLADEQHAHEQTKGILKERSEQLNKLDASLASTQKTLEEKEKEVISIKQILAASKELEKQHEGNKCRLNELQRKITCEHKARGEAEKLLQSYQEKTKELETTLATAQKLLKRKQEPENECEWILNREDIHLNEEKLGSGAFGTVYKGMFRGTQVAVKQVSVKPSFTEYNVGKFRSEMKMASRCRHPCMLQFIGATSDDQSPLLVTELLDTSLKSVLHERALDPVEIETIALDVARGLNYLHLNQPHPIVHRDISSGNVLLWKHGQSWQGKISDYGNAVLMSYARTGSGGALPYLAPEMYNQRFSTKSDVYSYGVLLLEMCIREEPSCCDDRDELICLVEDGGLRKLIRSCLQQDSEQRPAMEEVLAVLTTAASQLTGTN